jgi:hypothetical protein
MQFKIDLNVISLIHGNPSFMPRSVPRSRSSAPSVNFLAGCYRNALLLAEVMMLPRDARRGTTTRWVSTRSPSVILYQKKSNGTESLNRHSESTLWGFSS